MTIRLTDPVNIAGAHYDSGSTVTLARTTELLLIGQGRARDLTPKADTRSRVLQNMPRNYLARRAERTLKKGLDLVGVTTANSGTAATVSIDAASPFGTPAIKVAMPAGNTYAEVQFNGHGLSAFDGHVVFRVWVEDYTAVQQLQLFAGRTGYDRYWQTPYALNNSSVARWNGEHLMVVGPTAAATVNTFVSGVDALGDCKMRIFPGAAGANVWVERVSVPEPAIPTFLFTFDDASLTWMSNVLPILDRAGLRGTFGINTAAVGTNGALYLNSTQVAAIAAAGHQVSSHNLTNTAYADGTGGTQTAAQYTADFRSGRVALAGWSPTIDWAYHPWVQGRNNQAVMDTMRAEGLMIGRGIVAGHMFPTVGLGQERYAIKTFGTHQLADEAAIDAVVGNALRYGTLASFMTHEVVTTTPAGVETARRLFEYLVDAVAQCVKAGSAQCLTARELVTALDY